MDFVHLRSISKHMFLLYKKSHSHLTIENLVSIENKRKVLRESFRNFEIRVTGELQ